jgi:hypothetical protein
MASGDKGRNKFSDNLIEVRNSWTETSSLEAKENALGNFSEIISWGQLSFQKRVEVPSPTILDTIPLKMGVNF